MTPPSQPERRWVVLICPACGGSSDGPKGDPSVCTCNDEDGAPLFHTEMVVPLSTLEHEKTSAADLRVELDLMTKDRDRVGEALEKEKAEREAVEAALKVARDALTAWEHSSKENDPRVRDLLFDAAPVARAALTDEPDREESSK